ncbi:E3 binding domain-containing protein [Halalkalicoccus subterraneus]|uniref:E3 binding domain-containing protein n=1 Tax=Halalkalicoccus subterraneus TaxID=2675002 RepID=UPI000EFAAD41|nr:E3 binding domain-containing protein [Halalkalicoccus subterraneus]
MGYVVKMPKLGLEMERGTMLEWYIDEGESVTEDEVIAEIESEKSIGEIEAREDGVLRVRALEEGDSIPPGTPIGIVAGADEDITELEAEFDTDEEGTDTTEVDKSASTATASSNTDTGEAASATPRTETDESADVKASPRAERRAKELGVKLADIGGSGPQGAIIEADVEAAATEDTGASAAATAEQVRASPRAKHRAEELGVDLTTVDGSGPQGAITEDDIETAADGTETPTAAIDAAGAKDEHAVAPSGRYRTATLVIEGEAADTVIEAVDLAGQAFDVEPSLVDVLTVAVSATVRDRPEFNATVEDETHQLRTQQDIAIGTTSDGDLLTPVIENAGELSFAELVEARHETVDTAIASGVADGRATFALGLEEEIDAPVESLLTAPTVAGLLVNSSRRRAIPAENGVSLERCLSLSLAYDTRVLGDRDAEMFLETLLEHIDNTPELVLRTYSERVR